MINRTLQKLWTYDLGYHYGGALALRNGAVIGEGDTGLFLIQGDDNGANLTSITL